jgi:chromosome segregation ATPase
LCIYCAREEKEEEIDELNVKVKELHEEVTKLQADLEKKNWELKNLSRKTDEHIRKREEEQELAFEKKIVNLNKEHEKTVEMIRMNEQELKDELHEAKQILAQRQETNDNEVQTEAGNTEENEHLLCTIKELRNELQRIVEEKDDLARKLEEGTMENASKDIPEGRKDRSQSMTTNSEHLAYCQKAANKFHTIMAQMTMTDKKDKKDKPKSDELKAGCSSSDSRKCKPNKESEKRTARAKSPSLLTRLRERSPSKSKTVTEENVPTSPTHKYFLCPTDAERQMDEKRRVSPSRFYTKQRKESTSQLTSKPELCVEKSEKRPAWKF